MKPDKEYPTISRKRFKKLLMGLGFQKRTAEAFAVVCRQVEGRYYAGWVKW